MKNNIVYNKLLHKIKMASSPIYKNLKAKKIQSPVHLKEKIRKDYKNKVQTCRDMVLNRFRGSQSCGNDLRTTLTDIYNDTFNDFHKDGFEIEHLSDNEEAKILEEIKKELINNEIDWWLEEYEKSQSDNMDWSSIHKDDIICLLCQKNNFSYQNNTLSCETCKIIIKTEMSIPDIKKHINSILERHSNLCSNMVQFTAVSESYNTHIYFICEGCMDMQLIL